MKPNLTERIKRATILPPDHLIVEAVMQPSPVTGVALLDTSSLTWLRVCPHCGAWRKRPAALCGCEREAHS